MVVHRAARDTELRTFFKNHTCQVRPPLSQPTMMASPTQDRQMLSAVSALRASEVLSVRKAAELYGVPESSLRSRINGTSSRAATHPNSSLLTPSEIEALVKYILDLDSRGFSAFSC